MHSGTGTAAYAGCCRGLPVCRKSSAPGKAKLISSADLQPVYLRLSQAERERLQREKSSKSK